MKEQKWMCRLTGVTTGQCVFTMDADSFEDAIEKMEGFLDGKVEETEKGVERPMYTGGIWQLVAVTNISAVPDGQREVRTIIRKQRKGR